MSDGRPKELITDVLHDARELAAAEVDKIEAKAKQVGETAKIAGVGIGMINVAAIVIAQALALLLVWLGLMAWVAFAIIGVALAVAGIVFIKLPREAHAR